MPYFSLVNSKNNQVVQIVDQPYQKFECHSVFFWKDGPDSWAAGNDYHYDPDQDKIVQTVYPPLDYAVARRAHYDTYTEQLDKLWHDMDKGIIPGKETSDWFQSIKAVKESFPKS